MTDDGHPDDVLVSPEWVHDRLDRFGSDDPGYRLVEVNVDPTRYDEGHVPGAVGVDWTADLQDTDRFDVVQPAAFARLLGEHGITDGTTVVLYGDLYNWFAAYAYWLFTYYGHDDVRLLDGGWDRWVATRYPESTAEPAYPSVTYPVPSTNDAIRADRPSVVDAVGSDEVLVDARAPPEYDGEILAPPGWNENVQRGGHIPGATNVPWSRAVRADGRFKPRSELEAVFADVVDDDGVIVYCRIGERSALTWVALHELLGIRPVRHYYGSWVEWGNTVGAPVER